VTKRKVESCDNIALKYELALRYSIREVSCSLQLAHVLFMTVDKPTYLAKQEIVNAIRILPLGTFIFGCTVFQTSQTLEGGTVVGTEFHVSSVNAMKRSDNFKHDSYFPFS
jgi:hypothetical protein